jgi:transposase
VEGVLSVEDWAEIRRLHRAEKMPIKAIARVMKVSRNTVRAAIASDRVPCHNSHHGSELVFSVPVRLLFGTR